MRIKITTSYFDRNNKSISTVDIRLIKMNLRSFVKYGNDPIERENKIEEIMENFLNSDISSFGIWLGFPDNDEFWNDREFPYRHIQKKELIKRGVLGDVITQILIEKISYEEYKRLRMPKIPNIPEFVAFPNERGNYDEPKR